jgi:hypothetical protein
MIDVLGALPPLAPGVRSYDRPLKERGPDGEVRPVDDIRLVQLYKRDAPEECRLATLMISRDCEKTAVELAQMLVEQCKDYGYFVDA